MVLVAKKKQPPSIHHKRRHGSHHARDDRYHKAYWPYLPMALIVGLGVLVNTFWGTIQQSVLSYATNMNSSGLLQETNEERVAGGLGGLTLNAKLNQAAQAKANDMASRDYWSHNTPEGNPPWTFFTSAGYEYQTAGENLAYGFDNSTEAVIGWMNSPGHKANILNASYQEVGFGIADVADYQGTGPETIVVAMYASPVVASAVAPAASQPEQLAPQPPVTQPAPTSPAPSQTEAQPTTQQEINATPVVMNSDKKSDGAVPATVATQRISRVQLLSGSSNTGPWSTFAISALVTVAAVIFFLRHGLLWRRVLVKSEAFVHKHPLFDVALVSVATLGFILTRTDGIIR